MKQALFFLSLLLSSVSLLAQTNILSTNPLAEVIMLGNYNPSVYMPTQVIAHPDSLTRGIQTRVSPDSLKSYIIKLSTFRNRNTGSDTVSSTIGIGAARRWVYQKFQEFSALNENRLIPSYLQFDLAICGMPQHRNIFCVLPGTDTSDKSIIIIEGHMDSRCEGNCDILCNAQGIEDNASGTALVMELARVMAKYAYKQTIVFLVTIGEEQGLYGADAFADYVQQKGILVKAVQNNDVIGGVICGQTSSPPSCSPFNDIDSLNVRLFSQGSLNSKHKGYARFIKLEYKEQLSQLVSVPSLINIMSPEDRTGRSGDHVPFRQHGYTAMRFTSANEHGDANVSNMSYSDRQHTTRDTLGIDTDNDQVVDSFFVDFNYLARNAVINGNAAAMCATGPKQPDFNLFAWGVNNIIVQVTQQTQYGQYRVGIRTTTNDWDTVYTMTNTLVDTFPVVPLSNNIVYVSIMSVDTDSIESIPSQEKNVNVSGLGNGLINDPSGIELLHNKPNPFDEATYLTFYLAKDMTAKKAEIIIRDIAGRELKRIPVVLNNGMNEVLYEHGYGMSGVLTWSLIVDGKVAGTREMVFAN